MAKPAGTSKRLTLRPSPARPAASDQDAQAQLDVFLARYDPAIEKLGRKTFARMARRLPGAVQMVYDNYNALVMGFGPTEKVGRTPFSVALYPRWVTVFFLKGAALDDPGKRLSGSGTTVRSIRIDDEAALTRLLADEEIDALISAAVMHVGWTLDRKASSRLMIKSISPTRRPRRPAAA